VENKFYSVGQEFIHNGKECLIKEVLAQYITVHHPQTFHSTHVKVWKITYTYLSEDEIEENLAIIPFGQEEAENYKYILRDNK